MNHHKVQNKRAIAELKLLPTDLLPQMQGINHKLQVTSRIYNVGEGTSAKNGEKIDCVDRDKMHNFKCENMTKCVKCVMIL